MPVEEVTTRAAFQRAITGQKLTVVDFYATWCGPCKAVAPRLEALSSELKTVLFIKVDVDQLSDVAQERSVTAMPTFHIYEPKTGKQLHAFQGDYSRLQATIRELAKSGKYKTTGTFNYQGYALRDYARGQKAVQVSGIRAWAQRAQRMVVDYAQSMTISDGIFLVALAVILHVLSYCTIMRWRAVLRLV